MVGTSLVPSCMMGEIQLHGSWSCPKIVQDSSCSAVIRIHGGHNRAYLLGFVWGVLLEKYRREITTLLQTFLQFVLNSNCFFYSSLLVSNCQSAIGIVDWLGILTLKYYFFIRIHIEGTTITAFILPLWLRGHRQCQWKSTNVKCKIHIYWEKSTCSVWILKMKFPLQLRQKLRKVGRYHPQKNAE